MFILIISLGCRTARPPPPQDLRLPDHLFVQIMFISCLCGAGASPQQRPGPQVLQVQPHCGEEPPDADLRHRGRSEREAAGPHRSGVGWVLVLWGCLSTPIAQCRLRNVVFTASWMVCITTSVAKFTLSLGVRCRKKSRLRGIRCRRNKLLNELD